MKIDPKFVEYIQSLVRVCYLTDIDGVVVDRDGVRGLNEQRTAVLIEPTVPTIPFKSLGLTRIQSLKARLDITKNLSNLTIEAIEGNGFITSLVFKAKGTKIDYRCGDSGKIPNKKAINDEVHHEFSFSEEAVGMLQRGISAMQTKEVTLIGKENEGVTFELVDTTNDVFSHTVADEFAVLSTNSVGKFAHRYPTDMLLALLKENGTSTVQITANGVLKISVHGFTLYLVSLK